MFPAGIVLLSVVLLSVSVLFSIGENRLVWKTSTFGSLFQRLPGCHSNTYKGSVTDSEMEEVSTLTWARLEDDDQGHFVLHRIHR